MENKKINDFEKYEHELEVLVREDKNNWARFYVIMEKVEKEELYKQKRFRSFTAWLKNFAIKNKVHESVLWNRKKAGKVYKQYQEIQAKKGIETQAIEKINVSMDSLVLLDKIQKKAPELGTELIEKTINKEITRQDLRSAYKKIRDAVPYKKASKDKNKEIENEDIKNTITATKITQLFKSSEWLLDYKVKRKAFRPQEEQDKYVALSEFRVYTGSTKKSRRIDVVVLENVTTEVKLHEIHVHGVEIKINKYDLVNDHKYAEYTEFVHFLWVAIPTELVQVAQETVPPTIGILEITEKEEIKKVREAIKGQPIKIIETLKVATIKLI